jgi:predicted AAA+ superfamily ATPase
MDYFTVLKDTLVGALLPAFTETKNRKAMTSAKFYFFDVGVRLERKLVVTLGSQRRKIDDGVEINPANEFLEDLWSEELF